jgi:hypothetical protein
MAAPRTSIPELPEQTVATDTDELVVQNGPTTKRMTVGRLTTHGTQALNDHINALSNAHQASAISAVPAGPPFTGDNVQIQLSQGADAINGLNTLVQGNTTALADHIADTTAAHVATAVAVTPAGTLVSTNVQAALAELQTEIDNIQLIEGPPGDIGPAGDWSTPQPIEATPGAAYNVGANDAGKLKRLTSVSTITLPADVLTIGQRVDFVCVGGPASFVLGGGATWDVAPTPSTNARTTGSFVSAIKMAATAWALAGDLG